MFSRTNFVFIICLSFLLIPSLFVKDQILAHEATETQNTSFSYENSKAIDINGDDDFRSQAKEKGWDLDGERDGTQNNPFIIRNLVISDAQSTFRVKIKFTTVYFVMENIELDGSEGTPYDIDDIGGIFIDNVENGAFYNLTIHDFIDGNFGYGFKISECSNIKIIGNTIVNIKHYGIKMYTSSEFTIVDNSIKANSGISMSLSNNSLIKRNKILGNEANGISIYGSLARETDGMDNIIEDNLIESKENGIYFGNFASNNTVEGNSIISEYGIRLGYETKNLKITGNIFNTTSYGILFFTGGFDTIIKWNNIFSTAYYTSQISSSEESAIIENNYYDKQVAVDADDNGYLDEELFTDPHPLSKPYTISKLTSNSDLVKNENKVTIEWNSVECNYGHDITYSIYYKQTGSLEMIALEEKIVITSFDWDIANLSNAEYTIIIAAETEFGLRTTIERNLDLTSSSSNISSTRFNSLFMFSLMLMGIVAQRIKKNDARTSLI